MKSLSILPIAVALVAATTSFGSIAEESAADAASTRASGAATLTRDSRALMNQRMRKCKVMTGDEKTACEKDAHTVSQEKARGDKKAADKP